MPTERHRARQLYRSWATSCDDVMLLVDIVADEYLQPAATAESPAPALMAEETSPNPAVPAAPVAAPVPVVVPALQLPVVEWLQWGVMARLLLVAFLFTYNRNLSTEKLAHMAGMTLFSYLFQIGAFGYFIAWICHVLGFNFNPPPPEPMPVVPNPAAEGAGGPDAAVQDGMAGAGVPPDGNAGGDAGGVAGARGAGGVGGAAAIPAPAPLAPPAPLNMVQYLNVLYHSGFTIPTAPGILLDVVSLFMGLFFSIVPSWAPYRLHR